MALRVLSTSHPFSHCLHSSSNHEQDGEATAALLLSASPDDGNTLLHCLCLGEGLGLGGSLLLALAGRSGAPVWPARHQRGRGQLLALLLVRQPRLALLAGCRNAAGDTPLHAAVRSQSWQVLALLLAALQQLVAVSQPELLPLLLGAQNADGLAPAELALALRQWPAVRLLAAAARGAPPPSRSQLEACSLVQHYLSGGRGGSLRGGGGEGQLSVGPLHVSASGASVTDALGGLLSKLWDAFSTAPGGAAAAESLAAAARLEEVQGRPSGSEGSAAAAAESSSEQRGQPAMPMHLQPAAMGQADVLQLIRGEEEEAQALSSASRQQSSGGSGGSGGEAAGSVAALAADVAGSATAGDEGPAACCLVCYEDLPAGGAGMRLPCRHPTCDACWRGILLASIDEGNPRRAICPQPGCGSALPSTEAARLLPAAALGRLQRLQVQAYLATHPQTMRCCPQAACGAMLHVPAPPATAVPGAGLDAECGCCSQLCCWRCGEEAHEPATCDQMRRWGEELGALRRAAPDADRQWLASNTKRCPKCRAHIEKHGGCNHIVCSSCGEHFCWSCGGAWRLHSPETGGYYVCSLDPRSDLPEYAIDGGGGGGGGSLGRPLAWLAGVWSSIKASAQQQQLQRHLRQYLRLSGGGAALHAAAAHMERLLAAAGMLGVGGCGGPAGMLGPEQLGVSAREAARMSSGEWADLSAATAASAAAAVTPLAPLALPAAKEAADAALAATASHSGTCSSGHPEAVYLQELAAALVAARRLLQHAAVALYLLPGGAPRRHLQQLAGSMQARLEQLEPLLLALPERDALPPPPPRAQQRRCAPAPADHARPDSAASNRSGQGSGGSSSGRGGGFPGWLLHKFFGVEVPAAAAAGTEAPERHPALAGVPPDVLVQQAQHAVAVHQQRHAVLAATAALVEDMWQVHCAARAGLYA